MSVHGYLMAHHDDVEKYTRKHESGCIFLLIFVVSKSTDKNMSQNKHFHLFLKIYSYNIRLHQCQTTSAHHLLVINIRTQYEMASIVQDNTDQRITSPGHNKPHPPDNCLLGTYCITVVYQLCITKDKKLAFVYQFGCAYQQLCSWDLCITHTIKLHLCVRVRVSLRM